MLKRIENALEQIAVADALMQQAAQKYSNAKKQLEELYKLPQTKKIFSDKEIAKLLSKKAVKKVRYA